MSYSLMQLQLEWICDTQSYGRDLRDVCRRLGVPYKVITLKDLAKKYGYSYGYVRKVACIEKWRMQRRELIRKINIRTREKMREKGY